MVAWVNIVHISVLTRHSVPYQMGGVPGNFKHASMKITKCEYLGLWPLPFGFKFFSVPRLFLCKAKLANIYNHIIFPEPCCTVVTHAHIRTDIGILCSIFNVL